MELFRMLDSDSIVESHERKRRLFEELNAAYRLDPPEPCKVGDRVLIHAELAGEGFSWDRVEATVIEASDTAYCVRIPPTIEGYPPTERWVHRAVVLEVLPPRPKENPNGN